MKYLSIVIMASVLFLVSSCKKDETKVIMNSNTPVLSSDLDKPLVLLQDNKDQPALTFTYDDIDLGFKDALSYILQISVAGHDFKSDSLIELDLDRKALKKTFTAQELNLLLLKEFLPPGKTGNYEFRIRTSAGNVYSNVVPLTITTYQAIAWAYVPGAYQGWEPSTADSLISATGNGIYTGTILFTPGNLEFKITPAKSWDIAYGDAGDGNISTSASANLVAPGAGSYQITANFNDNTYSIQYNQWSIIGDATAGGWNADTDMKFNNGDSTWSVVAALTAGGSVKFRYNHDWGVNYGGSAGTLKLNGDNIPITTTGTYSIKMDLPHLKYTITKQ
ncbi:hypothetical protein A8C56_19410 [Niabella ginsenosidivorans]|uniref:Uncharacterized protein n=1 Tax=Niabella ginsenosidivorans TaxID=1176587 RepID=A0A1A9I6A1_9BACT|nr:SusE domain-containing protein [Niabella ginsenosidivorans]ANH82865.1 hypothetical protein A8C56_19410 [Niabella ginsenosidivorans]